MINIFKKSLFFFSDLKYLRELYKGRGWEEKTALSLVASYLALSLHSSATAACPGCDTRREGLLLLLGRLGGESPARSKVRWCTCTRYGDGAAALCTSGAEKSPQQPPSKHTVPLQGSAPSRDFPGCWIQSGTRSHPCRRTQLQDRHPLTTVSAVPPLNIHKTRICFHAPQPPQHQDCCPTQCPGSPLPQRSLVLSALP